MNPDQLVALLMVMADLRLELARLAGENAALQQRLQAKEASDAAPANPS